MLVCPEGRGERQTGRHIRLCLAFKCSLHRQGKGQVGNARNPAGFVLQPPQKPVVDSIPLPLYLFLAVNPQQVLSICRHDSLRGRRHQGVHASTGDPSVSRRGRLAFLCAELHNQQCTRDFLFYSSQSEWEGGGIRFGVFDYFLGLDPSTCQDVHTEGDLCCFIAI